MLPMRGLPSFLGMSDIPPHTHTHTTHPFVDAQAHAHVLAAVKNVVMSMGEQTHVSVPASSPLNTDADLGLWAHTAVLLLTF